MFTWCAKANRSSSSCGVGVFIFTTSLSFSPCIQFLSFVTQWRFLKGLTVWEREEEIIMGHVSPGCFAFWWFVQPFAFRNKHTILWHYEKIKDEKYIILFLRVCTVIQELVLAELWILENHDPVGDRAQILFNREVTASVNCNCTRTVTLYAKVYIMSFAF